MFEKEISNFQSIVQEKTIGNAPSIALKHILESNVPQNVKIFFKAEVEALLFSERQKESRSSRFNYNQEDIGALQGQLDGLLVFHYEFSRDDFFQSLDRSVHFLFNYLCRPQWTLENFLFEETDSISIRQLEIKFRFCLDYGYYWTILKEYLSTKNKTELNRDEAVHLLRKIDGELIKSHSAVELGKMTEPFYRFITFIHVNSGNSTLHGIPIKALIYFFEDKRVRSVVQHLTKLKEQGTTLLQYEELIDILKDSFVKKGFSVEEEAAKLTIEKPVEAEHPKLQLTEKEKQLIISSLFGDQEIRFNEIVENILSAVSWDDAALILDHYFTMNDVDPFSQEAIVFTNALQTYFTNHQSEDDI
jgi:hypothetical protein